MSPPRRRRPPGANRGPDVVVTGGAGDKATVQPISDAIADLGLFAETVSQPRGATTGQPSISPRDLRDHGISLVEGASDDQDKAVVDQAVRELAKLNDTVSANDIRPLLPNVRPSLIGARFLALAKAGVLEKTGRYIQASHSAGHGRMVAEWRWVG